MKIKINNQDSSTLKKLLHWKGNHKQDEKTSQEWEEILTKQLTSDWSLKYTNSSRHSVSKKKLPSQKEGRRPRHFSKKRDTYGQQAYEKMLNITNYYRNADQNSEYITSNWSDWPSTKNLQTINPVEGCGEKATLLHYWWEYKLVQILWKTV